MATINQQETDKALRSLGEADTRFNVIMNGRAMRDPIRKIYIHSVSKRSFRTSRNLFKNLNLVGCENGERYVTSAVIADPIIEGIADETSGGSRPFDHDGWRAVLDLLNPNNFTPDPYNGSANADYFANRQGQNLMAEGLFPSLNETPTEKELQRAEESLKKHYQWLTREAARLSSRSKKDLDEFLQSYPQTHEAMDAMGITAEWHSPSTVEAFCPNCGDKIRPGIAFHTGELGPCVIDPVRAYKAGVLTKERMDELMMVNEPVPAPRPRRG